ncbi:MAG: restriction endonuclease [Candidatus Izemoplasmatales bacterium]
MASKNPAYSDYFFPLLRIIKTEKEWKRDELYRIIETEFNLSQEQMAEMLPGGQQQVYKNRIGWALTYLLKAGLISRAARGTYLITEQGKSLLNTGIRGLSLEDLNQIPQFVDFKTSKRVSILPTKSEEELSPDEMLGKAYLKVKLEIKQELLKRIMDNSPEFFEILVLDLVEKLGYGNKLIKSTIHTGKSGDQGIDGIIKGDFLGFDNIYIQAKRWNSSIGSQEIQKFIGAITKIGANKGIFITTSDFTQDAEDFIKGMNNVKIILIDGDQLTDLMYDRGIGVSTKQVYLRNIVDSDYFDN